MNLILLHNAVECGDFSDFVAVINKEISDVDLALRRSVDEYNSSAIIALVKKKKKLE